MFKVNNKYLRELLCKHGLSIPDFAKTCGITLITAKHLIFGSRPVKFNTLAKVARKFNIDVNDLILDD